MVQSLGLAAELAVVELAAGVVVEPVVDAAEHVPHLSDQNVPDLDDHDHAGLHNRWDSADAIAGRGYHGDSIRYQARCRRDPCDCRVNHGEKCCCGGD